MMAEYGITSQPGKIAAPAFQDFGVKLADSLEDVTDVFGIQRISAHLIPPEIELEKGQVEIPSSRSDYQWAPLPGEIARAARLVTISRVERNPSSGSEQLPCDLLPSGVGISQATCKISHVDLDTCPEYEAVSYTWLNFEPNIPLVVDDNKTLHVNASLFACLQRLLEKRDKLVLWWDQICVDQTNMAEKDKQVQLMKVIFERAKKTYIWLGESNDDTDFAISVLESICSLGTWSDLHPAGADLTRRAQQLVSDGFRNPNSVASRRRNAVARLLNRPWFERAWIFQEAAVCREAVFLIGRHELGFNQLCNAVEAFCAAEQSTIRNLEMSLANSMARVARGYSTLRNIRQCREELAGGRETNNESLQTILSRLSGTVTAKLSHDLVYAFLAFQDQRKDAGAIKANYALPVGQAYNEAAASLIAHTKRLDLFCITGNSKSDFPDLASWAPDWTQRLPQGLPIYQSGVDSPFDASKDILPSNGPNHPLALPALRVQGRTIDEVRLIAHHDFRLEERNKGGPERFLQLQKHLEFLGAANSQPTIISSDAQRKRMLKVLIADGAFTYSSDQLSVKAVEHKSLTVAQLDELLQAYDNDSAIRSPQEGPFFSMFLPNVSHLRTARQYLREKSLICYRKKVIYTKNGSLGLAPQDVKIDDLVCVLHGSKVPIVLRKLDGEENGKPCYRLVGQCYLEGAMYGGIVDSTESKSHDFVLL